MRAKAPAKRSQHVNATYRNIVGRNLLRAFGHHVASCCDMLGVVGSSLKMVKEVWIGCKTLHRIPFMWPLRLAVRQLEGLRFVKIMAIFEIISATDLLTQNIIRIVCLCWFTFDIFNQRALIYENQTSFPHALYLKRSRWSPIFISFLKEVNPCLSAVEV